MSAQLVSRIRILAAAVTVLVAAGCTTLNPQLVETQTRGKTIAVASMLGPNLRLKWVGTTAFNNEEGEVAVPTWGLDAEATKATSSALLATQRYLTVKVFTNIAQAGEAMPQLPADAQADFLLLLKPKEVGNPDPMYGTNQFFGGVGIAQRSFMGLQKTRAHVAVNAELYDLSAGKLLGARGEFEHWPINAKLKSGGRANLLSNNNPVPTIDEHELAELQQPITSRLVKIIDQLLGEMGLR